MSLTTRDSTPRRPGMTLIEIMVAVAIVIVLVMIAVVATRAAMDSARRGSAKSAMRMITMAIEEYSRFWPAATYPAWHPTLAGQPRATAGFPEFDCTYLWDRNDDPPQYNYFVDNTSNDKRYEPNECLAYSLLSAVGGGPYLKKPPGGMVITPVDDVGKTYDFETLHGLQNNAGQNVIIRRLVDPWGTPYAYQWLGRTNQPISSGTGVAVKVRIISAGPDGMFGDTGGTDEEKQQAGDNIYGGPTPTQGVSLWE